MTRYSLKHLADHDLLRELSALVNKDRANTAELLAHLAEVDERKLYLPAAYPSMFAWCVGALGLSEDAAAKRIQVARLARRFPGIFPAVADGRLSLSVIVQLATYLTPETADELLAAAANRSRRDVELLLASRFPRPAIAEVLAPVAGPAPALQLTVTAGAASVPSARPAQVVANAACQHAPGHVGMTRAEQPSRGRTSPLSAESFALQCTLTKEAHELLKYAQALEGHTVAPGDLGALLLRALRSHVERLEQARFARASRTRTPKSSAGNSRHIPAHVRREVWQRDRGRCTFVGTNGRRCDSDARLEFDHVTPFARDGEATAQNLRLRCRAHNQYEADRTFGRRFMDGKRESTRKRPPEDQRPARSLKPDAGSRAPSASPGPGPAFPSPLRPAAG